MMAHQVLEPNTDIQKAIEICRDLCRENEIDDSNHQETNNITAEQNPFEHLYNNSNADVTNDIYLATLHKPGPIAKKENIIPNEDFYQLMRISKEKQKGLLLHVNSPLLSSDRTPFRIFFTGPAGCGKTFAIKLLMEIYNCYTDNDGYCNAYITCASTGKASVAITGTTVQTALKISLSSLLPLNYETA
ncbi:ATP-dependent DNA helicase [Trichonephila clavata]|uniref:ATP-dependent DNA helicase n=1 Tax=Trichonephila clavata TaxID=2740835 RepID=A0A8X6LZQ8_TRICU|nr:ATP-dependent DNA helicase [Trichonephila clavata]